MKISKRNIASIIIFLSSIILLFYFVQKIDRDKFEILFLNLNNKWFFLSYLICIFQTIINIFKFNLLIKKAVNFKKLTDIFFIASLLNFILPFKLGEIKKIYLLKKRFKINYLKNLEIMIVDKIFEISFFILFSILIFSFWNEIDKIYIYLIISGCIFYIFFLKKLIFFLGKKKIFYFDKINKILLNYTILLINFKKIIYLNLLLIILTFLHFKIFLYFADINSFSFLNIIGFVSIISLIGFIPITYNGLGFREFFILFIFGSILSIEQILLISIFLISRGIPSAIIGIYFFLNYLIRNK
jgi:uncharacterized membrane protein YbhN (UPF0104 family)